MTEPFLTGIFAGQNGVTWKNLSRVQASSLALHLAAVALLLNFTVQRIQENGPPPREERFERLIFPGGPTKLKPKPEPPGGGGSGGNRNPIRWTRGQAPPFERMQLVPPSLPRNSNAILLAPPTLVGIPEMRVPEIDAQNYGDPRQILFTGSQGPG
jgi:hypothetical protein